MGSGPGTHGGYLAALGLAAMRTRLIGELGEDRPVRALATHFLAPVADRPLALHAVVERVGRDAAVCSLRAEQGGALVLVGSATFGASRSGPDHNGSPAPAVPGPDDCPPLALPRRLAEFARHLEIRPATAARRRAGRAGRLDAVPGRPSARRRSRDGADRRPAAGAVRHLDDPAAGALGRADRALRHRAR